MPIQDPNVVAQKWAQRLGGATEQIKQGVNAVTTSPMEKAALRVDAYRDGVAKAANSGKWTRGLRRRTLEDWKQAMIQKGAMRIADGANKAIPKMQQFLTAFLPYVAQGVASLPPRGGLDANKARAIAMMDWNARFTGRPS